MLLTITTLKLLFFFLVIIILINLIFSVCKSWSVNDQKELGGIVDIEWWCNEVFYMFGIIYIFKLRYC